MHLPDLLASLESAGLRHRYPDLADELVADGAVLPLSHASGMEVDLVLAESGLEALAIARATKVAVDGVLVPVAHATDLAVMKVLAGRGKDLDDLRSLLGRSPRPIGAGTGPERSAPAARASDRRESATVKGAVAGSTGRSGRARRV